MVDGAGLRRLSRIRRAQHVMGAASSRECRPSVFALCSAAVNPVLLKVVLGLLPLLRVCSFVPDRESGE